MTYIVTFIMVLFFSTTESYANEVKRADDNTEFIIDNITEFKKIESPPPSQKYKPTYRKDTKYKFKKKIDIRKLQPRNPDEIYSCDENVSDIIYDDEVCARQIIVMVPCLIAPCPTEEHWSTYPSAEHACSHSDVTDFALGRCLYDSEE